MTKQKEIQTETVSVTFCDVCGERAIPWLRRIKPCRICKKDICDRCAIITDHWYLESGHFAGDYPDHYCKDCWERGEDIRKGIQACRDAETQLWEKWHNG